jgi:hypothetical protein
MLRKILALSVVCLLLLPGGASAHSWYDGDCCSGQDCDVAKVTKHPNGVYEVWMWGFKTFTDRNTKMRKSKDKNYHACIVFERSGGVELVPVVRCLYIPDEDELS